MNVSGRSGRSYYRRGLLISIVLLALSLCLFAGNQHAYANGSSSILVETKWLQDNLDDPNIRIMYVGGFSPESMAKFGSKHIPGSVYVNFNSLMKVLGNGSVPPDKAEFEALMSRLGISNDTLVVIYGSEVNPFISNALWLLDYFGHKKVRYLNGGIAKWTQEKRRTAAGAPAQIAPTKYKAVPDKSIFANADYVLQDRKSVV